MLPALVRDYAALLAGAGLIGIGSIGSLLTLGILRRHTLAGLSRAVSITVMGAGVGIGVGWIAGGLALEHMPIKTLFLVLAATCATLVAVMMAAIPRHQGGVRVVSAGSLSAFCRPR